MSDEELRLKCLELALQVHSKDSDPKAAIEYATCMYKFVKGATLK